MVCTDVRQKIASNALCLAAWWLLDLRLLGGRFLKCFLWWRFHKRFLRGRRLSYLFRLRLFCLSVLRLWLRQCFLRLLALIWGWRCCCPVRVMLFGWPWVVRFHGTRRFARRGANALEWRRLEMWMIKVVRFFGFSRDVSRSCRPSMTSTELPWGWVSELVDCHPQGNSPDRVEWFPSASKSLAEGTKLAERSRGRVAEIVSAYLISPRNTALGCTCPLSRPNSLARRVLALRPSGNREPTISCPLPLDSIRLLFMQAVPSSTTMSPLAFLERGQSSEEGLALHQKKDLKKNYRASWCRRPSTSGRHLQLPSTVTSTKSSTPWLSLRGRVLLGLPFSQQSLAASKTAPLFAPPIA